jgi:hypothetical protein
MTLLSGSNAPIQGSLGTFALLPAAKLLPSLRLSPVHLVHGQLPISCFTACPRCAYRWDAALAARGLMLASSCKSCTFGRKINSGLPGILSVMKSRLSLALRYSFAPSLPTRPSLDQANQIYLWCRSARVLLWLLPKKRQLENGRKGPATAPYDAWPACLLSAPLGSTSLPISCPAAGDGSLALLGS